MSTLSSADASNATDIAASRRAPISYDGMRLLLAVVGVFGVFAASYFASYSTPRTAASATFSICS